MPWSPDIYNKRTTFALLLWNSLDHDGGYCRPENRPLGDLKFHDHCYILFLLDVKRSGMGTSSMANHIYIFQRSKWRLHGPWCKQSRRVFRHSRSHDWVTTIGLLEFQRQTNMIYPTHKSLHVSKTACIHWLYHRGPLLAHWAWCIGRSIERGPP